MEAKALTPSSQESQSTPPAYVPYEEAVARWAAWYESLPQDLREAIDERGRNAGKGTFAR
jgi:hypothetical protein